MNEPFEQYLAENKWLIWEKGLNIDKQAANETRFTIGNGYLGIRGIYEEIPNGSQPGTFITGVFDSISSQVSELVNAPNPIDFRISFGGEKVDITAMDVLSHQRALDMSKGLLVRKTIYSSAHKRRFNYQSLRFVSMQQKHIGVYQVFFTPLDEKATISVQSSVNESIMNKGLVTEGSKKHFHIYEFSKFGSINYLAVKTFEKNILISYASQLKLYKNYKNQTIPHRVFRLSVNKGETVVFTKYFSIHTSHHIGEHALKKRTIKTLKRSVKQGFDNLLRENTNAWHRKWSICDIAINGNTEIDRALRFNIYHMIIAAQHDNGFSSIGAKNLSGEGYRGHVFWDTEIFLLPFFAWTLPYIAKSLLLYRYNRLPQARTIAADKGYKGALFPWESADDGFDCTPKWHKDYDGQIIPIFTMQREHHISSDIAFAVHNYYAITNDYDFMLRYGMEIILETARFWVSRMQLNSRTKHFDIKNVIGPDEFHEDVNNNAYTNLLAQWNISTALKLLRIFRKKYPADIKKLILKLKITRDEIHHMNQILNHISNTSPGKNDIIKAFDGYPKKRYVKLYWKKNEILPEMPKKIPLNKFKATQLVKQADVLMLLYLLSDRFNIETKKKNYDYYIMRTLHKSSLSPSIHSLMANEVGYTAAAYKFFLKSIFIDLEDIYGNTPDGMHSACLGGVWQSVVYGFGGLRVYKGGILSLNPKLPAEWNSIKFNLKWKGIDINVAVFRNDIELYFKSNLINSVKVIVYNRLRTVRANLTNCFHRKD
ncbi:MAG: glycosyl hydrolase family 65 protein [bacterium]